jgi:hypothetical protein
MSNNPEEWQEAMHEALVAMNAAVRAYQRLLEVVPFNAKGRPFAEITIHYDQGAN